VRSSSKVDRAKKSARPGGRKLLTRDEVELEPSQAGSLLPEPPLQKAAGRRRRTSVDETG
jgi:hypothetical protein